MVAISNHCKTQCFRNSTPVKHHVLKAPMSKTQSKITTFASKIMWWLSCGVLALLCAILAPRCHNITQDKWKNFILEPTSSNIAPQTRPRQVATGLQDSAWAQIWMVSESLSDFILQVFSSISPSILHGNPASSSARWRLCARSALDIDIYNDTQ